VGLERPRLLDLKDLQLADGFDCGTPVLNEWLRLYAWPNQKGGSARVYVSLDTAQGLIAGFYCLAGGAVQHKDAPKRVSQGLARHPIPVVLIGRLAVDQRYAGQGIGRFLIQDAFRRIIQTADSVDVRAVIVQAKNDSAAKFYRKLGFQAFDSDPMLFFQLVKDIRKSYEGK
jgi:GNAT superfamily N-acetyltransferase